MLVNQIKLRNIMGIESLDISPRTLTVISSKNGEGKTSILKGIQSLISGGTDASLVRAGQDKAEVVLVLDDDITFRKAFGKKQTLHQKGANKIPGGPQKAIESLIDALASNPVEFFHTPKGKRAELLLDTVKVDVDPEALAVAAGIGQEQAEETLAGSDNHLKALANMVNAAFDTRTGVNREMKSKTATVKQLSASLPPPDESGAGEKLDAAREEKNKLESGLAGRRADIATTLSEQTAIIREKAEQEIEALKGEANAAFGAYQKKSAARISELAEEVGKLAAQVAAGNRAQSTLNTIEFLKAEVAELCDESDELSKYMINVSALRLRTLKDLPIDGLELGGDGDISIGGIPFDKLNTEKQIRFVLKVATLRAADMPVKLICLDGLECLDDENFAMFKKAAEHYGKQGFQFIVTKVSNDAELKVEDVA